MPPVNCCHALLQPLAKNVSSDTAGSVWATDVPGWITAVGTALLAVFAILTTIYAVRAFRKQSQEVSDQASMLQIQSEQLAEQRKVNAEQIRVLALQAAELGESLAERKREALERRNAQASQVSIAVEVTRESRSGILPELEAIVVNASERQQPIYDVRLYWYLGPEGYGTPNPELLGTVLNWEREPRRREFPPGTDLAGCGAVLTFRDAAGVNWIRTSDGALMHTDSDLAPDLVKALSGTSPTGSLCGLASGLRIPGVRGQPAPADRRYARRSVSSGNCPCGRRLINYPCPAWCALTGAHETHVRCGGAAEDGTVVTLTQPPGRPPRVVITNVHDQSVRITLTSAAARELARYFAELGSERLAAALDVAISYAVPPAPGAAQRA